MSGVTYGWMAAEISGVYSPRAVLYCTEDRCHMSISSMISGNFDWKTGTVVFWDLHTIDVSRPLADQTEHLKEDLAQIEYPADIVLDVGWYPEFAATGNFVVCVVQQGEWERPLFRESAFTIEDVQARIVEGVRIAAELVVSID